MVKRFQFQILICSKDDFELKFGEIGDLNSSVSDSAFLVSVIADANITKNEILIPAIPVKFNSLSLWLDANDSELNEDAWGNITLWLDANDSSTIDTGSGNEVASMDQ